MNSDLRFQLDQLRAVRHRCGLYLDFDGTLAPIVNDPGQAQPMEGISALIDRLADRFGVVAVISGRPIQFLQDHLDVSSAVRLHGHYGLQHLSNGAVVELPAATKWRSVVDAGATLAEAQLPSAVRVERKGLSFVLHYRVVPDQSSLVQEWAACFAQESGLDAQQARLAIEIGPFHDFDKGNAILEMSTGLAGACAIGDDIGDLPMFNVIDSLGEKSPFLGVKLAVESPELPARLRQSASAVVEGPTGVQQVLDYLAS